MEIALIAHDKKKEDMVRFVLAYQHIFQKHHLYATGTTGKRIMEATGMKVHRFQSGPYGGDQEIGALIAKHVNLPLPFIYIEQKNYFLVHLSLSLVLNLCIT